MIIYKIVNKINSKVYVGQTTQPLHRRIKDHAGDHSGCLAINNAIKKYGLENFEISLIEECSSREELNKKEVYYIKNLNSLYSNGYNLREGGSQFKMTDLQKEKISKTLKEKKIKPPSRLGTKISDEHKDAIGLASKTRKRDKKSIEKMLLNRIKTNNREIICVNDGLQYKSITKASVYYGLSITMIWRICSGLKSDHNGLIFKYLEIL